MKIIRLAPGKLPQIPPERVGLIGIFDVKEKEKIIEKMEVLALWQKLWKRNGPLEAEFEVGNIDQEAVFVLKHVFPSLRLEIEYLKSKRFRKEIKELYQEALGSVDILLNSEFYHFKKFYRASQSLFFRFARKKKSVNPITGQIYKGGRIFTIQDIPILKVKVPTNKISLILDAQLEVYLGRFRFYKTIALGD